MTVFFGRIQPQATFIPTICSVLTYKKSQSVFSLWDNLESPFCRSLLFLPSRHPPGMGKNLLFSLSLISPFLTRVQLPAEVFNSCHAPTSRLQPNIAMTAGYANENMQKKCDKMTHCMKWWKLIMTKVKYVFSRVGKTLPTPQLLGHWATAPIAL